MKVGQIVRIKEIAGTRLASKRKPVWGRIITVGAFKPKDELNRSCLVSLLSDVVFRERKRSLMAFQRRHFDLPTDKQVPDWVWAEIAKRALQGDE